MAPPSSPSSAAAAAAAASVAAKTDAAVADIAAREAAAQADRDAQAAYLAAQAARADGNAERPYPGPFENLHREARDTLASNLIFQDAKVEMTKPVSQTLQMTHRFIMGGQPTYSLSALHIFSRGFLMAELDHSTNLSARGQFGVTPSVTLKGQTQLTGNGDAYVGELEYEGSDHAINAKVINPRFLDGAGVLTTSYFQSLSRRLAVGAELTLQRDRQGRVGSGLTFAARYTGGDYTLTGNVTTSGSVLASYFQRVNEQITVAAELEAVVLEKQRESVVTVGAKFDLRMATLRAQIDSMGRMIGYLEHRLQPNFSVLFSGELDHFSGQARFGVGMQVQ